MKKKNLDYTVVATHAHASFKTQPFYSKHTEIYYKHWHDEHPEVVYLGNSLGFRGNDFCDADTVVLGCSVTSGIGLPFEKTWPHLLAGKLGIVNNISLPGGSVAQIADVGMDIMSMFKPPKRILLLTPNLERLNVAFSKESGMWKTYNWDTNINEFIAMQGEKIEPLKIDSYDGKYRSLPLEFAVSESFRALIRLGLFAKLIGSTFHYFSWLDDVNAVYRGCGIDGFVDGKDCQPQGACHEHLRGGEFWDCAIDRSPHPGAHHHVHYAERFETILGIQ